jgi:hypothetical protein
MNAKDITFGEFLQRKREEKEITLRRMAEVTIHSKMNHG